MVLFAIFLLVILTHGLATADIEVHDFCPSSEAIYPCTCRTNYDEACIITCTLVNTEDLERLSEMPNLCEGHVHFVLFRSKVSGIPTKLWKQLLSSKTVDVSILHSTLEGFTPPNSLPISRSYTPGDIVIKVSHSNLTSWNWNQFEGMNAGDDISIIMDDTILPELDSDFATVANGQIHKVTIVDAQLARIPDGLFKSFRVLESLGLQNNNLSSISRSLFPMPASRLRFLHLNGNFLTSLPDDLFSHMPVLEIVYLRENRLKSLPQDIFLSVVSPKLHLIDLVNNPWKCNCRLMWIVNESKYHVNMGVCDAPTHLAGKKFRNLPKLIEC